MTTPNWTPKARPSLWTKIASRVQKEWFLLGMLTMVLLATLFPTVGMNGGPLKADTVGKIGTFGIFLFHGMSLSLENLRNSIKSWRLHVVIQCFTFILFPLLFVALQIPFSYLFPASLVLGFLLLCILPSTLSSSIAMTAIAHGNIPAAIFNASLSSLLGIFLTPLLLTLFLSARANSLPMAPAIIDLMLLMLLPFVLGQAGRILITEHIVTKFLSRIYLFDELVVLWLVFNSFSDSVAGGLWMAHGTSTILYTLSGALFILLVILTLTTFFTRKLKFSKENEITAVFCGSKKTLASGIPIGKILFAGHPAIAIIVLPIMFYHQLQLFVCSILANRYAKRLEGTSSISTP